MIKEQLTLLLPLVLIIVFQVTFGLYVLYNTPHRYYLKWLLAPILVAAALASVWLFRATLGYGFPLVLPEIFEYLAHKTVVVDNKKKWIDVFLISRKPLSSSPRVHRLPWSKETEKMMQAAKEMQKEGGGSIEMQKKGKKAEGKDPNLSQGAEEPYTLKRKLPEHEMPKDRDRPESRSESEPGTDAPQRPPVERQDGWDRSTVLPRGDAPAI